jgi:hypothetical protein
VGSMIRTDGSKLTSLANGKSYECGALTLPTVGNLRAVASTYITGPTKPLKVSQISADVRDLHRDPANAGALFQVASQFNLLEMVSPDMTPECGLAIYENDMTQGPACAIACGAGTIFRNYLTEVNGQDGQDSYNQIDCLDQVGELLGNVREELWSMKNGYMLPSLESLRELSTWLSRDAGSLRSKAIDRLKIGVQWDTQVTLDGCEHKVTQAYCSAVPVSYSRIYSGEWEEFGTLILEAAYEATICAGIMNAFNTGNNTVFLTSLGGGAFGNPEEWITAAMDKVFKKYARCGLDVKLVRFPKKSLQSFRIKGV